MSKRLHSLMDKYTLQDWSYIATILAAIVAATTLIFIYREIREKREQEKRERSFHFIQRIYEIERLDYVLKAMDFFRDAFTSPDEKLRLAGKDPDIRKGIKIVFNYYEELGLAYNKNILDREIIELMMGEASISNYNTVKWFVERFQKVDLEKDPNTPDELLTYIQWTNMYKALLESRKHRITNFKKKFIQFYKGNW